MPHYSTAEDCAIGKLFEWNEANNQLQLKKNLESDFANHRVNYGHALKALGLNDADYVFTSDGDLVPKGYNYNRNFDKLIVAPKSRKPLLPIPQGVRDVELVRDASGLFGMRLVSICSGIFVCFVKSGSPAAKAGIRFGDQIVSVNGDEVTAKKSDRVASLMANDRVELFIRDRPFAHNIMINKDKNNSLGFNLNDGMISSIVASSSASRNGLLTRYYVVEIDGSNVVGLSDNEVHEIICKIPDRAVVLTVMSEHSYRELIKKEKRQTLMQMDRSSH